MSDPIAPAEQPPYVAVGLDSLKRHLDAIPPDKSFALVLGYERSATLLPRLQIGTAWRATDHWQVAADTTLEKKAKPTTRFYTAFTW